MAVEALQQTGVGREVGVGAAAHSGRLRVERGKGGRNGRVEVSGQTRQANVGLGVVVEKVEHKGGKLLSGNNDAVSLGRGSQVIGKRLGAPVAASGGAVGQRPLLRVSLPVSLRQGAVCFLVRFCNLIKKKEPYQ